MTSINNEDKARAAFKNLFKVADSYTQEEWDKMMAEHPAQPQPQPRKVHRVNQPITAEQFDAAWRELRGVKK